MQMVEPPIEEITRRIVEAFSPLRVVMFGSRARGTAKPHSDVDIFVEMESELPPEERMVQMLRLFRRRCWAMDILVFTPGEVAAAREMRSSLVNVIDREGKVLYARQ